MSMNRSNGETKRYILPLMSAAVTAAVLSVLFYARGLWPLGGGSVLTGDLYSQYAPLLYRYCDVVTGRQNLFAAVRVAGGVGLYVDTINEVLNPFNYILLLFGREKIYLALNVLLFLYFCAASFTSALFLVTTFPEERAFVLPLSVAYGISSYAAFNYQIIKWMIFPVLFPLLLLSIRRLERGKRGILYSLLLAWSIVLSIQLGFETCLYVFFGYGFYLMLLVKKEERKRRAGRFVLWSFAGVLLSSFVLIPNIYSLLHSARSGYSSYLGVMQQHGLDDLFERLLNVTHPMLLALFLFEAAAWVSRRRQREKESPSDVRRFSLKTLAGLFSPEARFFTVFTAFLLLTVLLQPANLLWHIGSYRCFPVRYGYMVLLTASALVLRLLSELRIRRDAAPQDVIGGSKENTGRWMPILLTVLSAAAAAAALILTVHYEDRITAAFATMAISLSCRWETILVFLILVLYFAAFAAAIAAALLKQQTQKLPVMLTILTAVTSLSFFLFQIYPGDNAVRTIDEASYASMTAEWETKEENGEAGPVYRGSAIFAKEETDKEYPRDAALVTGSSSLTSYLPALPEACQRLLSDLGYTTYWVATTGEGGTEETNYLLDTPMLLPGTPEDYILSQDSAEERRDEIAKLLAGAGEELHPLGDEEIEENEAAGTIRVTLTDAAQGETVVLPLACGPEWTVTVNGEKQEPEKVFAGLIGIRTVEGDNVITLSYRPVGLTAGIAASAVGALLVLLLAVCDGRRAKREQEKAGTAEQPAPGEKRRNGIQSDRGPDPYLLLWKAGILVIYIVPAIGLLIYMGGKILNLTAGSAAPADTGQTSTLLGTETEENGIRVDMTGENLMMLSGVKLKADSKETKALDPKYVKDGLTDREDLRWSSSNDTENCDHWLEVRFPEEETIGVVRITWERLNAKCYAIEISDNGRDYTEAAVFTESPADKTDEIRLSRPVTARYLRLHVTDVVRNEADASLYYQNVSVLEMEVYAGVTESFVVAAPVIGSGEDRVLTTPEVPDGYTLTYVGADYESIIHEDGTIDNTIAPVTAEVGYALSWGERSVDLPGMQVTVPASLDASGEAAEETGDALPNGVEVREWRPEDGTVRVTEETRIVIPASEEDELRASAELLSDDLKDVLGMDTAPEILTASDDSVRKEGDIALQIASEDETALFTGLTAVSGDEGCCIDLGTDGRILLTARNVQGLRWAEITLEEILDGGEGSAPAGLIRDYPRYSVRGFGIDVGRRAISLDFLKELVKALSGEKMNTLEVHLNDNQILSLSGESISMEEALSKQSGFRLESDLAGSDGNSITSTDLYYTKEEFGAFIDWAYTYGVEIIPEIDTPAHALAITRVFPEQMLGGDAATADELDLSDSRSVELGKELWTEYVGDGKAFADAKAVGIGMDEYYGDGEDLVRYCSTLEETIHSLDPDMTVRAWASFDWYDVDYSSVSKEIEFKVWQTVWQDPEELYENGYKVINSLSADLYIIPGGGMDRLDTDHLAKEWEPNVFSQDGETKTLPAYSSRMLGAVYMMWNEYTGTEVSEDGLYERFLEPLPVIAGKLWGR